MKEIVERVCAKFGGHQKTADAAGVGLSAISNWKHTGIPDAQKWRLQQEAERLKIDLGDLLKRASVVKKRPAPAPGIAAE